MPGRNIAGVSLRPSALPSPPLRRLFVTHSSGSDLLLVCLFFGFQSRSCRADTEGEAKRNDSDYMYVAAWEFQGEDKEPLLNKEPLDYEAIEVKQRNYK